MHTHIQKWGNSLAVRIPRLLAEQARIGQGSVVDITVVDEKLQIEVVPAEAYTLESLLEGVTDENLHEEVNTGLPRGKEVW